MSVALCIAWLLPLTAGFGLWMALNPARGPGWFSAALGCGGVLGLLLAAAFTALFSRADTAHAWAHAAPWLAGFAGAAFAVASWRRRSPHGAAINVEKVNKWIWILLTLALVSLGWRGWLELREVLLRPTFPWDAWDAWAVKSKTWFLLGHYAPFVSMHDWLTQPTREAYTSIAWSYPSTLAWLQVWFASAAGGWIEPMVNLPWFGLWLGLLIGHYGQWRALGLDRARALAAVYALGSLPLLDVHVALAGYADLWIATFLGFAVLAWLRWMQTRDRGQLAIAVICAAVLPLLKLEGAVWLVLLALVAVYGMLSRRWRWMLAATFAAILAIGLIAGRLALPLPGLGVARFGDGMVTIPGFGSLALAWHGAALADAADAVFVQPNWHLLWWLAPAIVLWRWRQLRTQPALRALGALLLLGIGFLLFLFTCTDAAQWAESYSAINRLILHVVPAAITLLALLCRSEPRGTGLSPVALSHPA